MLAKKWISVKPPESQQVSSSPTLIDYPHGVKSNNIRLSEEICRNSEMQNNVLRYVQMTVKGRFEYPSIFKTCRRSIQIKRTDTHSCINMYWCLNIHSVQCGWGFFWIWSIKTGSKGSVRGELWTAVNGHEQQLTLCSQLNDFQEFVNRCVVSSTLPDTSRRMQPRQQSWIGLLQRGDCVLQTGRNSVEVFRTHHIQLGVTDRQTAWKKTMLPAIYGVINKNNCLQANLRNVCVL